MGPIGASIVYIIMLLKAAGLEQYETEAVATLFIFEWFCDRIRTAVNVGSDLFIAKISDDVHKIAEKKDKRILCGCFYKNKSLKNDSCAPLIEHETKTKKKQTQKDNETQSWLEVASIE